jgi:hypothetical protein
MEQDTRSYYEKNKERLQKAGREYHYANREKHREYSKQYYQTHKEVLNQKRSMRGCKPKTRERACLTSENPTPTLEARRQSYQDNCLPVVPPPSIETPIETPGEIHRFQYTDASFTVCFT